MVAFYDNVMCGPCATGLDRLITTVAVTCPEKCLSLRVFVFVRFSTITRFRVVLSFYDANNIFNRSVRF